MAMILDAFIGKFTEVLVGFAKEEVVMVLGVKEELKKLQKRMLRIQRLLEDAEKKKFEDSAIDSWLSELKDVMYDADDIIDLCRITGAQLLADPVCCNFSSVFCCFTSVSFRHEIGRRIKELNDRLNQVYEDSRQFQLEKLTKLEIKSTQVNTRQTSSLVDDAAEGREIEEATNQLVQLLISTGDIHEKCCLFAVTGMGGIGKTTLAQKVFNDPKTKIVFNLRIWVCISQNYSEIDLLQQVIREAKGHYGDAKTKSELLPILQDSVGRGGSLILVLDDIWREDVWRDLLRVPLCNANIKARILVTTRNDDVARKMGAAHIYPVKMLSVENGWEMLCRRLFTEGEEELACSMREVGLQILERCAGLPLAIKAIAGVLASKDRSKKEWDKVNRSDAWSINKLPEDLRGALYLSYEDLPSHLKQCFLYCSLYPEDATLYRRDLSKLWVAEGFVREQPNSSDILLEELAEDYYNELVRRNLLLSQPNPVNFRCKMHDLYHSLAQFLSRDEISCGTTNLNNSICSLTKLRRLSLADKENATEILDSVEEQGSSLRTLFSPYGAKLMLNGRLKRLSHLRVLQMNNIDCLPDCIGDLVHLRYLDLAFTSITQIPESIERLANLQLLSLNFCESLTTLPTGITRLHNLRCLGLLDTPLSFIPKGLGGLEKLNDLIGFVVADNMDPMSSGLEELNSLKQLRILSLCNLERAQSGAVILRELPYLSELYLFCSQTSTGTNMEEQIKRIEKLFNELIPPQGLEILGIQGYFGIRYPNWMSTSPFGAYLTYLYLGDITSCTQLPPLGQLPELKSLNIKNAMAIKKIGAEFLGGDVVHETTRIVFPKLELLEIHGMLNLEEWSFGSEVETHEDGEQLTSQRLKLMPCLQELSIMNCPLLKQLPQGLRHTGMKILTITKAHRLTTVVNLPTLRELSVNDCKSLFCVEKLDALQMLTFLDGDMESLPEWLLKFLQQRHL